MDIPNPKTLEENLGSSPSPDTENLSRMVAESLLNGVVEEARSAGAGVAGDDKQGTAAMLSAQAQKKKRRRAKKGSGGKALGSKIGSEEGNTNMNVKANVNVNANANAIGQQPNQNVLCISRNKHWKYISSYHGPWLQLPLELLESLMILNIDPATVASERTPAPSASSTFSGSSANTNPPSRKIGFTRLLDQGARSIALNASSYSNAPSPPLPPPPSVDLPPPPLPPLVPAPGKAAPPPIDPGVFRCVVSIRRLIDEAAELSVRASSGLSAAALGSLQAGGSGGFGLSGSTWAAAQALGLNPLADLGGGGGGGRNVPMSANRVHRLRALAVSKLAEAYRADEIASSVMVMQRGTVFDDIAEKVLKHDPKNVDARYVHFFHEKIPSRQLAESTSTTVLDQLIAENPQRLELYRTRGIVHCFRDEYGLAVKDFSHALKEARAVRKVRQAHNPSQRSNSENGHSKAKRKKNKINGQAPPDGTAVTIEGLDGEQLLLHPSVLPDAPEPIELQSVFLRASSYFAHAMYLIEQAFFKLEELPRVPLNDFGEMQLAYIRGRYGGTEVNNPDGPLGRSDGVKAQAYRAVLGESPLREQVCALLRKSKRDHERFLAYFDSMEPPAEAFITTEQQDSPLGKIERAFALLDLYRPMTRQHERPKSDSESQELTDVPLAFTTYHPLMLESHFTILNCLLMLGEFENLTSTFERTAAIVAGLEGYPVFLPPRSMAQGEFMETLERLASGWKYGKMPNALVRVQKQPARNVAPMALLTNEDALDAPPIASSCSAGPSTSTYCGLKPLPSPGRRSSFSEDVDADADFTSSDCTSANKDTQSDLRTALEHLRFLLAPVHARLRARAESAAANEKARNNNNEDSKKPTQLGLALHSARVEVILAWLGAVHLPELEAVASSTS